MVRARGTYLGQPMMVGMEERTKNMFEVFNRNTKKHKPAKEGAVANIAERQ